MRAPAKVQFDAQYQHGGGWHPMPGWKLNDDDSLKYFRDAHTYQPLAEMILGQERIIVYECSWVAIVQPDRSFEVCRMD
jgi:hypothetical protein